MRAFSYLLIIAAFHLPLSGCLPQSIPAKNHTWKILDTDAWYAERALEHHGFISNNSLSIQSYLREYARGVEDSDKAPSFIPIQNGFVALHKEAAERLPQLLYYSKEKKPTGEHLSLENGVPDGFEPDIVRISDSAETVAVLYKDQKTKYLCLFSRHAKVPSCNESIDIYDLNWTSDDTSIIATFYHPQSGRWEIQKILCKDFSREILYSISLPNGFLLLKRSPDHILVEQKGDTTSHYSMIHFHDPALRVQHLDFDPAQKNMIKDRCSDAMAQRYTSYDGTLVPFSLAVPAPDRPTAVILRFYGAYGHSMDTDISPYIQQFIDEGFAIATLGIRGGGDCGKRWEAAGSGLNRLKAVEDVESAVEYFYNQHPEIPIFLMTRSAGGLLAAITLHEKQKYLAGAILEAPFVSLAEWKQSSDAPREFSVWGDLRTPEGRASVQALQDRVQPVLLPLYIWLGAKDSIVPIEWTRTWIDKNTPHAVVAIDRDATHDGPVNTAETAELYGEEFAFVKAVIHHELFN